MSFTCIALSPGRDSSTTGAAALDRRPLAGAEHARTHRPVLRRLGVRELRGLVRLFANDSWPHRVHVFFPPM